MLEFLHTPESHPLMNEADIDRLDRLQMRRDAEYYEKASDADELDAVVHELMNENDTLRQQISESDENNSSIVERYNTLVDKYHVIVDSGILEAGARYRIPVLEEQVEQKH